MPFKLPHQAVIPGLSKLDAGKCPAAMNSRIYSHALLALFVLASALLLVAYYRRLVEMPQTPA